MANQNIEFSLRKFDIHGEYRDCAYVDYIYILLMTPSSQGRYISMYVLYVYILHVHVIFCNTLVPFICTRNRDFNMCTYILAALCSCGHMLWLYFWQCMHELYVGLHVCTRIRICMYCTESLAFL